MRSILFLSFSDRFFTADWFKRYVLIRYISKLIGLNQRYVKSIDMFNSIRFKAYRFKSAICLNANMFNNRQVLDRQVMQK